MRKALIKKKIVVIGAGVGGSACAALLAQGGHEVVVLESHPFVGGRSVTHERDGFIYDFGVHMFSLGEKGPHGEVNKKLSGNLKWITKNPSCRVMGKIEFDFPLNIKPLFQQIFLALNLGVRVKNYWGTYRLFRALLRGKKIKENDTVILRDYVSRFTNDEVIHLFINCISQLYFALSYEEASAGEFILCFSRMFNNASFGYPKGGSGSIPYNSIDGLSRFGGQIKFNEKVVRIKVENRRAVGVETESGFYPADIVISNAGLGRTIDLAGEENFSEDYVKTARGYRYSNPYTTLTYALDRRIIPYPVVFYMPDMTAEKIYEYISKKEVPEDPYLFMPIPSNLDPSLAPEGKQLVIAGTPVSVRASDELCHKVLDRVHLRVCKLFPELEKAILWQERGTRSDTSHITKHAEGGAVGIGQFHDQSGTLRPALKTPLQDLWLVGADAGSRGVGTEMAAESALNLARLLNNKY
jgi:phytoene dehydrogenase-like protein